jgi:RNA polymerase sigma factor (TIGR02999 family)
LLSDLSAGNEQALAELLPLIYDELRAMAARYLGRERPGHTLQATALVHEAYFRLVDQKQVQWRDRAHFFAIAAQAMRRILVDHARARHAVKRGADFAKVELDEGAVLGDEGALAPEDLLAIDRALTELAALDPTASRIVELRFFGGFTVEEIAEVLDTSVSTVKREWTTARAWLHRQLVVGG